MTRRFDPVTIAAVCFTEPEIVSAGLGPLDVEGRDDVIQAVFPLAAIGRALAIEAGEDGGFVRVLASKADHRILGVQAVGQHVAELSNSFAQMLEMGAVLEDVAGVIHVHPTLGEAFHEASAAGAGARDPHLGNRHPKACPWGPACPPHRRKSKRRDLSGAPFTRVQTLGPKDKPWGDEGVWGGGKRATPPSTGPATPRPSRATARSSAA